MINLTVFVSVLFFLLITVAIFAYVFSRLGEEVFKAVIGLVVFCLSFVGILFLYSYRDYFWKNTATTDLQEVVLGSNYYDDLVEYNQVADGVFLTYYNDFGQEESVFLQNYIIEHSDNPALEIRKVKIIEKKTSEFFVDERSTTEDKYVIYFDT